MGFIWDQVIKYNGVLELKVGAITNTPSGILSLQAHWVERITPYVFVVESLRYIEFQIQLDY